MPNRSEALRHLIREYVAQDTWEKGGTVFGTVTLTYNHHAGDATGRLTDLQHDFGGIIVRGAAGRVKEFLTALRAIKAVQSVSPVITALV